MAEEINISRDISPRLGLHDATGDPLFLPRLAGALLVIAGLVIGIDTAVFDAFLPLDFALLSISRAQTFLIPDGFWGFLSGSILPTGLGALLLVKAEGMRSAKLSDKAIMYGRAAGIAVAVAGLALGIWAATREAGDGFWAFLSFALFPMGVGLLILLSVEGIRGSGVNDRIPFFGRLACMAILVAGFGLGSWNWADFVGSWLSTSGYAFPIGSEGILHSVGFPIHPIRSMGLGGFWSFLGAAAFPMGIGLAGLLSVELIEARQGAKPLDNAAQYGKLAGGMIAVAGLTRRFLSGSILPMRVGPLLLAKAEGIRFPRLSDKAIGYGRAAGIAVAVAGLVLGISETTKQWTESQFWTFLTFALPPTGVGLLILLAVEGMRRSGVNARILFFGRLSCIAILIAGFGLGSWNSEFGGFWSSTESVTFPWSLLWGAAFPMGIGVVGLLFVELIGARQGAKLLDNAALYGKLAGGVIAIAGLALVIWMAATLDNLHDDDLFLISASVLIAVGFLIYRWSEDIEVEKPPLPIGWLAFGILTSIGLVSGIWNAVEADSKYGVTVFLGNAVIPVGLGLLCSPILKKPLYVPSPTQIDDEDIL